MHTPEPFLLSPQTLGDRVLITGAPNTGKTTLAAQLEAHGYAVHHGDSLIGTYSWSDASQEIASWFSRPGPWVIEGVQVPRALRKWLAAHPQGSPADTLLWLTEPFIPLTAKQEAMAKGMLTVGEQVVEDLATRHIKFIGLARGQIAGLGAA